MQSRSDNNSARTTTSWSVSASEPNLISIPFSGKWQNYCTEDYVGCCENKLVVQNTMKNCGRLSYRTYYNGHYFHDKDMSVNDLIIARVKIAWLIVTNKICRIRARTGSSNSRDSYRKQPLLRLQTGIPPHSRHEDCRNYGNLQFDALSSTCYEVWTI